LREEKGGRGAKGRSPCLAVLLAAAGPFAVVPFAAGWRSVRSA
jgi:hypothetical protein